MGAELPRGDGFRGGIARPTQITVDEEADEAVAAGGRPRASVGAPRNAADEIGMNQLPDLPAVGAPENDLVIRGRDGEKVIADSRMPINQMNVLGVL